MITEQRIKVDSEPSLELIVSFKQVFRKTLRMTVKDLKERLVEQDIYSYAQLPTERMWADLLTKEKILPKDLEYVLLKNVINLGDTTVNEVRAFR